MRPQHKHREVINMDNQHRLIEGYRELSQDEISAMNAITDKAQQVKILIDTIDQIVGRDGRWLAIAKTDLQKGFMFLKRAVARPETF